jgi:phenylpropionate dioxygenase-like ring-hydroxylating dioxygenase large terminal subunit
MSRMSEITQSNRMRPKKLSSIRAPSDWAPITLTENVARAPSAPREAGGILVIIFTDRNGRPRVVTARDARKNEKRRYQRRGK